jgi:protease I
MPNRKKVAILIDDGFEDSEFIYPYNRLIEAGMTVDVVAEKKVVYRGKHGTTRQTWDNCESDTDDPRPQQQ